MAAVTPWSIKGVDSKTRKMIKTQAHKAGVTIGVWLADTVNMAVMQEYAAELKHNEQKQAEQQHSQQFEYEYEQELKMTGTGGATNTMSGARYANPASRPPTQPPYADPPDYKKTEYQSSEPSSNPNNYTDFNTFQNATPMKNSKNRMRYNRNDEHFDVASNGHGARDDNRISSGFNVIENALTDLVDHIELADSHNSSALRDMQAQIAQLNQRSQSDADAQAFHQEFNDMEGRLSSLADRIDEMNHNSAAFSDQLDYKASATASSKTASSPNSSFEQSHITSRFDELFIKLDNISHQQADQGDNIKYLELGIQNQFDKISGHLGLTTAAAIPAQTPEIDQLEQKLAELSQRLDSSLNAPQVDPQIAELEQQIGNLSGKLTDLLAAPKPEYSPVPTASSHSQQPSVEITELRDSIEQINQRLEKTEQRLEGIDRLEDNMERLISSVSDIRENSHSIAQDAATAAIEAFANNADNAANNAGDLESDDDIDALIAAKFRDINDKNDEAEKIQISGFKTVQSSLEKIMDRLSRVEDGHYSPSAPPDRPHERSGQGAEQDFIQPGAERHAEQPQDITAKQNNKIATATPLPEVETQAPPTAEAAISAPPPLNPQAVSTNNPQATSSNKPQAVSTSNPQAAAISSPQADTSPMTVAEATNSSQETQPRNPTAPLGSETTSDQGLPVNFDAGILDIAAVNDAKADIVAAPTVISGMAVEDNVQQRPKAVPSSSADFIAAARRAAQQSYENDKDSPAETVGRKSLFKRNKAKKSEANKPEVLATGTAVSNLTPDTPKTNAAETNNDIETNQKKKFSVKSLFSKRGSQKTSINEPVVEPLDNHYTHDLPTDIFEQDFFNDVEVPAEAARSNNAQLLGNELSLEAQDAAKPKRKGAAPVVIALFCVTILVTAVSWYSMRPQTTMVDGVEMAAVAPNKAEDASVKPAVEASGQTEAARTILNQAKVGLSTATNGVTQDAAKTNFTPEEFSDLPKVEAQIHQPTAEQLEALRNKNNLITNSIPEANQKPYEKSLLGNHGKFSKNKENSGVGSSSLSKSIKRNKPAVRLPETAPDTAVESTDKSTSKLAAKIPTVKYGTPPADLPKTIGPKLLRQNAMIGQAAEQFEIANRYALGFGVDIDLAQSYKWFIKAAQNKLAVAQFSVGMMLEHGKGTDRNLTLARNYYQRAAEQGNLMSIYRLAMMNAAPQNPTTKPDFKVALKWFSMAANAGLVDAQYNLAVLYEKGHGTDVDLVETYKWYSIAANKGDKQAQKRANTIKLELSASQIVKAQTAIQNWKISLLPETANTAPKLAYLKNENPGNNGNTQLTKSKHVTVGTLATDVIADKAAIRDTQKMLTALGWNIGSADGILGAKTTKAIAEFQTRHNLLITGKVNDELLANLEAATL